MNFKTKKHLGQHLLIAEGVLEKIVEFANITQDDIVVEIGVGTGNLTEKLLQKKPAILYGIEIDETAYKIIEERFKDYQNFILIKSDFFDVNLFEIAKDKKIKLIGNLPYNVASLILVNIVFYKDIIKNAVFMVQKEVAEKLIAKPKSKDYTFLSVFIQSFFKVEYLMSVPARFFSPPPKVTSAVIKLTPIENKDIQDIKAYKGFVSEIFANRRRMLRTKIDTEILQKANIKETARVEELSIEDIKNLFKIYKQNF